VAGHFIMTDFQDRDQWRVIVSSRLIFTISFQEAQSLRSQQFFASQKLLAFYGNGPYTEPIYLKLVLIPYFQLLGNGNEGHD
jgi:hypothetical protein